MRGYSDFCDRCKEYRHSILRVPYSIPMPLITPETEPMIGDGYFTERVIIPEPLPIIAMCAECRKRKGLSY